MDIVGLGIDLAEIDRVSFLLRKYGERFKDRCFTDHEWEYAHRYADPAGRLAARFAGKEAVMKSLYTGWRRLRWRVDLRQLLGSQVGRIPEVRGLWRKTIEAADRLEIDVQPVLEPRRGCLGHQVLAKCLFGQLGHELRATHIAS